MNGRNKAARILVSLAAMVLIAATLLHLSDYAKDMRAVSASNLSAPLQSEVRSLFLLVGWDWLVVAIIMLISAFTVKELRKPIVLFCGFALLVTLAVILGFMGWFWGCGVVLSSALMILCGGLLFQNTAGLRAG
jgi:small basic protein